MHAIPYVSALLLVLLLLRPGRGTACSEKSGLGEGAGSARSHAEVLQHPEA